MHETVKRIEAWLKSVEAKASWGFMMYLAFLLALIVLFVLIAANELAFGGALFDSQTIGTIGGLGVLAAAFGTSVLQQSRGQGSLVLRNAAIWLTILTALVFGYWLFG